MITFVMGRSGCGKTEYLMDRLPALAGAHQQVRFLVPEQSSMALERRIGGMGLANVQVVSFRRLCNEVFRRFGGVAGSYMSKTRKTALIYRVLQEQRKNLVYYRSSRPSMGFVARLADAFSELERSGLEKQAALAALAKGNRLDWQEKYKDLFLLYHAYRAALDEENRSAEEDLAVAIRIAEEKGFFKGSALIADGFFGFTGRQRELLGVAFGQSEAVYCSLLLDPADPALMFRPVRNELAALKRLATARGAKIVEETIAGGSKRLAHEDLKHLEAELLSERSPKQIKSEHVRLMVGKNIREELSMVAVDIARKVREEKLRYRDFALVAGSLEEYGAVAESVFAKYEVPLFVDQGRASLGKPLFAFVQSALRMIAPERYFRREDLLAFLKTGLCGEAPDLIGRLENYCEVWQISGERLVRDADWTQNPFGMKKADEESEALLAELNGLRRRVREPLLRFRDRAKVGSGAALAEAIYGLLCDFKVEQQILRIADTLQQQSESGENAWETQQNRRLTQEYLKVYGMMADILDDIWLVFGDAPLSTRALEELIGLCGEEAALNVTPPTMDAVTIGEVSHSRHDGVKYLYVVGATRDLLPMPVSDSGLIGDRERRLLEAEQLCCDATVHQKSLQGRHHFYAAVFSAREEITFSYSAFTLKGEKKTPSAYVDRLCKLCKLKPIHSADMELYDFAVTRDGAREITGWVPDFKTEILSELNETPLHRQDPEDRLTAAVVQSLFGKRMQLSYSQIRTFRQCPFQYFMKKTLKIEAVKPVTFDVANIGTFVHYGLEKLVDSIIADKYDYDKYNSAEIQRYGAELAEEYLQNTLRDINRTNQFQSLYRRMTALFCMVAENVVGELRDGQYRPLGTEVALSGKPIPLSNGCAVDLNGSIDRVDLYETAGKTYVKVTDYKTGNTVFDPTGITNQTGVQLPIYLYSMLRSGTVKNPEAAVGCYMLAQAPQWKEPISAAELDQKLQAYYRRGGIITSDQAALDGLDDQRGSRYFKLRYNSDEKLYSNAKVYEPKLIQEMIDHMETVIKETAEEIYGGVTSVSPLIDPSAQKQVCAFCDYRGVCRYDPKRSKRRICSKEPYSWREEGNADE